MTLFIETPKRIYEISDIYVMALTFILFFAVTKITKAVVEKQIQKRKNRRENRKNVNMFNPRGGAVGIELSDDTELAHTILACIADNERYLVKDPQIIKIVFALVKPKIKEESLVLTPNMMRFLALKLINNDQTLIVKIGNILASSNNRVRLATRFAGSAMIGVAGALVATLPYVILLLLIFLNTTENCGYQCSDYFEHLQKEGPTTVYGEKSTGHLVIAGNDDARQVEIYVPSKDADIGKVSSNGEVKTTRTYTRARKRARIVRFSDFRKTDPVLSSFKDLKEPEVPQKTCSINDPIVE